ncbi:Frizzled-3, partial [Pseudolycoriella hygida]
MTAMPNLAGHQSQTDAENMINELLPIMDSDCSRQARFLLCASMFPLCSPDVSRPVAACKSLCETVKSECSQDSVAILWPKFIDCDALPQPERQELCMEVPQDELKFGRTKGHAATWPWLKNSNIIRPMSTIICPANFTAVNDECAPQCGSDARFTAEQKKIVETWTLALSAICFILTLFSLVTFWAEPMRFGYPERPVLFLALCYNLLSVCYLERVIFHNPLREGRSDDACVCCGLSTTSCLASYISTSYLTLSAATWWLIFSLCWYLSSSKQWSSEALEKKSGLFHVMAWVLPLAPPIAALLWGAVKQQELTGMCSSFGFVKIPTLFLLVVGAIFTILASRSLKGLSVTVNDDSFNRRLTQVRTRILVFSCVFFVPAFLAVVLGFFELHYETVPSCVFGEPCLSPKKYSSIPTLMRLFFILAGGSMGGMWVWSKKTCDSYRSRISSTPSTSSSAATKSGQFITKKTKHSGPLYAGINFHNVPIYNPSQGV